MRFSKIFSKRNNFQNLERTLRKRLYGDWSLSLKYYHYFFSIIFSIIVLVLLNEDIP